LCSAVIESIISVTLGIEPGEAGTESKRADYCPHPMLT